MRRADIIGGIVTILFGVFAITQAARLDYWSRFGPGSGFIPLWSSIFIVFGGILLIVQTLRRKPLSVRAMGPSKLKGLASVASVAGLTVLAAILMNSLGFTLSMFLFMATMVGVVGKHKWHVTFGISAFVAISFYFVFYKWLQVPLPKGFAGF